MASNINLADLSSSQGLPLYGSNNAIQTSGSFNGLSASGIGDINGDGVDDIIVGAPGANSQQGKSYVIFGSKNLNSINVETLTSNQGFTITGANVDDLSGISVSNAGDVNEDGYNDIIIGASNYNNGAGISYVIYGNKSIYDINLDEFSDNQGFYIQGEKNSSYFGYSVSCAGDINADGYDDLVIGAFFLDKGKGASYIIFGSAKNHNINLKKDADEIISIFGENFGDLSGYSVSGAGDINNDGYSDIVIGAPRAADGGKSYIVYGEHELKRVIYLSDLTTQGYSVTGGDNGGFGFSVSNAGDINKDGYDDIIVGAISVNYDAGASYIIYGNDTSCLKNINIINSLSKFQGIVINGATTGSYSGFSVSNAGDINNDGYDDVIIGSPIQNYGAAYVIYGGYDLNDIDLGSITNTQGFSITSQGGTTLLFGYSVSWAGDVNNDGYNDIIVGAPGTNNFAGTNYIIFGNYQRANIIIPQDNGIIKIYETGFYEVGDQSGYSVSGAGDINGDGLYDIVVGSPNAAYSYGESYVIYGSTLLSSSVSLTNLNKNQGFSITGDNIFSRAGASVSSAGDINGDSYADIVIGAPIEWYKESNNILRNITLDVFVRFLFFGPGVSYIIYGNKTNYLANINLASLLPSQGFYIQGKYFYGDSGSSVSGAGDINNDGYDDIIIGSPDAYDFRGISYVIFGDKKTSLSNIDLDTISYERGFKIIGSSDTGPFNGGYSGFSVSGIRDINKDGYSDIIIGAPAIESTINPGNCYLIYGNNKSYLTDIDLSTLNIEQGITIFGENGGDHCGYSVSGGGDINGDGFTDIVIGAPGASSKAGKSYIIYGQSEKFTANIYLSKLGNVQGFTISGVETGDSSGSSVSIVGDINNDGLDDIIIGAPGTDSNTGKCYVVFGSHTLYTDFNLQELTSDKGYFIAGENTNSYTCRSIGKVKDFNGDKIDDFIIGAPGAQNGAGTSYLIYGSYDGSSTPSSSSIIDSIFFRLGFSAFSFISSIIFGWLIKSKIAIYILDHWGHDYRLIYKNSYIPLKKNEIGLRIHDNELKCVVNNQEHYILIDDSIHNGISKGLHDLIMRALQNPDISQSFTLIQHEKNQLRSYLIANKYIHSTRTCCFLNSYTELGYIKGTLYNFFLNYFEAEHVKTSKKQIRLDSVSGHISMEVLSSKRTLDIQDDSAAHTTNPIIKDTTQLGDVENHATVYSIHTVIHNTPLLNHPQSSEIFKYAREIGGTKAVNTLLDYQGYISNDVNEIKDTIKNVFADSVPAANQVEFIPVGPSPTADNMHSSISNNNLMISLLSAQQIVEYIPIINYIAQGFNLSLPEVLDNKPMLITSHLVLGNAAAALLPYKSISNGMITSSIATSSYAMRLVSTGYLVEQRQDAIAQDAPMSSFETIKYCGASIIAYTLPNLAKCAVTKWFIPEAECSITGYDLALSASLGGADCYAVYNATNVSPSIPTTADVVVPYIMDSIAFAITSQYVTLDMSNTAMAMQSVKQVMSVVSAIVATDYIGRMVMDMVPMEVKESYIGKVLTCVADSIDNVYQTTNNIGSCFIEGNDSMLGCFTTVNLTQEV